MRQLFLILFMAVGVLASCDKAPQSINYGEDECDFCRMSIVDPTHAAQVVTQKGRNYKFDASECMIHFLDSEIPEEDMLHVLSTDYSQPGELIDARTATFIISENIPSPMGEFLSAVKNEAKAISLQEEMGGKLYKWKEVKKLIASKRN